MAEPDSLRWKPSKTFLVKALDQAIDGEEVAEILANPARIWRCAKKWGNERWYVSNGRITLIVNPTRMELITVHLGCFPADRIAYRPGLGAELPRIRDDGPLEGDHLMVDGSVSAREIELKRLFRLMTQPPQGGNRSRGTSRSGRHQTGGRT